LTRSDHREAQGDRARLNSCGRAAFGTELRVVDEDGHDVGPGEIGEIVFRGPQMMTGYWNEPEKTAETIRNGWLHSGDMATLDERGYLTIVDRKKDLIISGGANISSREVEEVLYWHPSVREASVIGKPDEEWGEVPHAFVLAACGTAAIGCGAPVVLQGAAVGATVPSNHRDHRRSPQERARKDPEDRTAFALLGRPYQKVN
jgi:acyl-CoA synthetase (AMP-forming)/AMP-acid ligase II